MMLVVDRMTSHDMRVFLLNGSLDGYVDTITHWVRENNLGRRIAWNVWRMDNDEAVTAFILRWHNVSTV